MRQGDSVSVQPPVPVEVEVPDRRLQEPALAPELEEAIRSHLSFRARVTLVAESAFGASGYKTNLTRRA